MLEDVALAYGGLDAVVVTAGIFVAARPRRAASSDEQWATDVRRQRDRRLRGGRRGEQDLPAAGSAREPRPHHERQRGGGEEGQPRLRHQQGRGQPPGARAGGRAGPARARQRRGAGDGGEGQHDVPARTGHRLADQVPDRLRRRRSNEQLRDKLASSTRNARSPSSRSSPTTRPRPSFSCFLDAFARRRAMSFRSTAACRMAS